MQTGPNNLLTDVAGLRIGNSQDENIKSGVTVLVADKPNVASVHVMGGAPGTRETDLLSPENTVQSVDALVLSGGSAFGLDAASGVQAALKEAGRGFEVGEHRIPIVPGAILFDLINGGDKDWGRYPPYREMAFEATNNAAVEFELGSVGAGTGCLTGGPGAGTKGGLGSASTKLANGIMIGALVAVNALGSSTVGETNRFWAAPFEIADEFGGLGPASVSPEESAALRIKFREQISQNANTTIAIIATDAKLSKGDVKRLAVAAHDGFARALWPAHTPLDGDLIFSIATGEAQAPESLDDTIDLSAIASSTMARAIARGIFHASSRPNDLFKSWKEL